MWQVTGELAGCGVRSVGLQQQTDVPVARAAASPSNHGCVPCFWASKVPKTDAREAFHVADGGRSWKYRRQVLHQGTICCSDWLPSAVVLHGQHQGTGGICGRSVLLPGSERLITIHQARPWTQEPWKSIGQACTATMCDRVSNKASE